MDERTPKPEWGPGPWQHEPDYLSWADERTGLACAIVRNMHTGTFCGYVGVPPTHPFFGWDYNDDIAMQPGDLDDTTMDDVGVFQGFAYIFGGGPAKGTVPLGMLLKAHQGVNWSGELPIGDDGKWWWFGFDCGHAWDVAPGLDAMLKRIMPPEYRRTLMPTAKYRDLDYVRKEVTSLAFQLRQLESRALIDGGVLKLMGVKQ